MRMSRGPSACTLKPRPPSSSCMEDTPISIRAPSISSQPLASRAEAKELKVECMAAKRSPKGASLSFARASASVSRSRPRSRLPGKALKMASLCPPSPSVPSRKRSGRLPGLHSVARGAKHSSTSSFRTGICLALMPSCPASGEFAAKACFSACFNAHTFREEEKKRKPPGPARTANARRTAMPLLLCGIFTSTLLFFLPLNLSCPNPAGKRQVLIAFYPKLTTA